MFNHTLLHVEVPQIATVFSYIPPYNTVNKIIRLLCMLSIFALLLQEAQHMSEKRTLERRVAELRLVGAL